MRRLLHSSLLLFCLISFATAAPAGNGVPGKAKPPKRSKKWRELQLKAVLPHLHDKDSVARAHAVTEIRGLELPEAAPPLVELAEHERYAYLARMAAEAAHDLDASTAAGLVEKFVQKKQGMNRYEQRNAVILLVECRPRGAGRKILSDYGSCASRQQKIEVLRALAVLKPDGAVGYIEDALGSSDIEVADEAAIAAGRLGSKKFEPALFGALSNNKGYHCMFAAWGLNHISDPTIFKKVLGMGANMTGPALQAVAKVFCGSAGPKNVDKLIDILRNSKAKVFREAAAIALGRLGNDKKGVQEILLARMLGDTSREVRGACWHALSRVANKDIVPDLLEHSNQTEPERAKYVLHLLGDLRVKKGSKYVMRVMLNERKNVMLRYAAEINFWKVADASLVQAFEKRLMTSKGAFLQRGLEACGFRDNPAGFRFLVKMLGVLSSRKDLALHAERALERMTGHFFGPYPDIWKKWFKKNPDFFTPKQAGIERKKWRKDFEKANKDFRQTKKTEHAVQLGLEYLARHQFPDGREDPNRFYQMCDDQPPCPHDGARIQLDCTGTTGLALLAFMGAGYSPEHGKYKQVIQRGIEYLEARELADGNFKINDLVGGYDRPISAQALGEAYVNTGNPDYGWACQKAIDFLTTIQNSLGGWRYRVNIETTDTSCMSWTLFAMKTAQKAGLKVRRIAFTGCYHVMDMYSTPVIKQREDLIDTDPNYAFDVGQHTNYTYETGYQNRAWSPSYATLPLGIMCRIFLGWRRSHPFCIGSANLVLKDMLEKVPPNNNWSRYHSLRSYPTYAWYYGTLAMFQMGGHYFRVWNERIQKIIPATQVKTGCARGSWPVWNLDTVGGRIYTTCMGTLTLETYYRYLPVLQN